MENRQNISSRNPRGIALVITLSVMVLLTVTLSKAFQDTALELKMIQHDENMFLGRQVNRSFLRVILFALKNFGANKMKRFISENIPEGLPIPITGDEKDGFILNPTLESMDHYLNLNGTYVRNDDGPRNRDIIKNIITYYAKDTPPQYEIFSFAGQIADAIDGNQEIFNENFLRGQEYFTSENPYFLSKNKGIDIISEIKVLPAFQRLNLDPHDINSVNLPVSTIKVLDNTCLIKNFNLNFLPKNEDEIRDEIAKFFQLIEGIEDKPPCYYSELADSGTQEAIVQTIAKKFNNIDLNNTLFKIPLNSDPDWDSLMESNFSFMDEYRTKLSKFFTSRSSYIRIKYSIVLGKSVFRSVSIVRMDYDNKQDTDLPKKIEILYFNTR